MKRLLLGIILTVLIMAPSPAPQAKVGGVCSNCHTMHNSQAGAPMARGDTGWGGTGGSTDPRPGLLVASCLGCHSSTGTSAVETMADGTKIPIVFNTTGYPDPPLAGGNFYWVKTDGNDSKGHNIFSDNPDSLTKAPGDVYGCTSNNSCHADLHTPSGIYIIGIYSCEGCHFSPKHHANDHTHLQGGKVETADQGWYRFLSGHVSGDGKGVEGFEDGDWQHTSNSSDHNEYKGSVYNGGNGFNSLGNTMTGYCTGCHSDFHNTQGGTSSPFLRHPSDIVIKNSGEYASAFGASGGTGTYDPDFPVARSAVPSSPGSAVNLGTDMVMCLSCHRAHGSEYDAILRWDYKNSSLATAFEGCNKCHTSKN